METDASGLIPRECGVCSLPGWSEPASHARPSGRSTEDRVSGEAPGGNDCTRPWLPACPARPHGGRGQGGRALLPPRGPRRPPPLPSACSRGQRGLRVRRFLAQVFLQASRRLPRRLRSRERTLFRVSPGRPVSWA